MAVTYYGSLCLLMALIITKLLSDLLPKPLAHHIASDSEGYVLAILLPLWIQAARPKLAGLRAEWPATGLAALASLAVGIWQYNGHMLGTVKTLNETFFTLAVLIPYVQLRRPLARPVSVALGVGTLVAVVALEQTSAKHFTTALAEGFVMLLIAPVLFDLADRDILDPGRPSTLRRRQVLWAGLPILALLSIALRRLAPGSAVHQVIDYGARAQEAWVGMLLLSLYFAAYRSFDRAETVTVPRPRADAVQSPIKI